MKYTVENIMIVIMSLMMLFAVNYLAFAICLEDAYISFRVFIGLLDIVLIVTIIILIRDKLKSKTYNFAEDYAG